MTCGIYCIEHKESGKKYIGKSVNIDARWWQHRNSLSKSERNTKQTNRHLWNAVQKYGLDAFEFHILEELPREEGLVAERELYWMDFYDSCNRDKGYNLRRDSSTKMIVHDETKAIISLATKGENNPNYGNRWNDEQRENMSRITKERRAAGVYDTPESKERQSQGAKKVQERLRAEPERFEAMRNKVKTYKQSINKFVQYTYDGAFIREWDTKEQILLENKGYKWQNIYAACNGSKMSYMDFRWRMYPKDADYPQVIIIPDKYADPKFQIGKCIQKDCRGNIPSLETAIKRFRGKKLSVSEESLVFAYLEKYDEEALEEWLDIKVSEYDHQRWEELYGEDGLGLDPEAGLIKD